jgi:hypothetical protein
MEDYEKLKQMLVEQHEKILTLETEVKRLSYRVDKLEADSDKISDDMFDGGRIIRS